MPLLTKQELGNIPCFDLLTRLLSVDKVNDLYDRNSKCIGPAFARAVLRDLDINYEALNLEMLDSLPAGPFITISNHTFGHIDGIILIDIFGSIVDASE